MTTFIDANYSTVSETTINFESGSKPAAITEKTGTDGSITYSTDRGGFATLSTGPTTDDNANMEFGAFPPSDADAVGISATLRLTSASAVANDYVIYAAIGSDARHVVNHGGVRQTLWIGNDNVDTRDVLEPGYVSVDLLWDQQADELIHRTNGCLAVVADASALDESQTHNPYIHIAPKNGKGAEMHVHEVTTALYRSKR